MKKVSKDLECGVKSCQNGPKELVGTVQRWHQTHSAVVHIHPVLYWCSTCSCRSDGLACCGGWREDVSVAYISACPYVTTTQTMPFPMVDHPHFTDANEDHTDITRYLLKKVFYSQNRIRRVNTEEDRSKATSGSEERLQYISKRITRGGWNGVQRIREAD